MARGSKSFGSKKTSFGKRTEAEKSFHARKKAKPSREDDSEKDYRPKKFSANRRTSSWSDSERPRRDGDGTKKPSFRARREDSDKPRGENRFSRGRSFSKPHGEKSDRGERPFERKSSYRSTKPFNKERGDDSSFERKRFSRRSASPSDGKKKNFSDRYNENPRGGNRFSKLRKDEIKKTFRSPRSEKNEKTEFKKTFASREKKPFVKSKFERTEGVEPNQSDGLIRLNKFMANSGVGSRREADEYIKMGLVTVNGETVTEMGHKVKPTDDVRYEGRKLKAEPLVYVLLNKPKGFITTTDDPEERKTVMDLVASACKERIYPVGRLDRNTTGLLLLTNDGDLADKLTHPSYNVKKIYKVELDRALTHNDFQKITDGVYLEEGRAQVDDVAVVSDDRKEIGIELHIGWNRIVRRIFEALGYHVERLDRVMYAGLDKKDIGRGQWRFLKADEIVRLKHFGN